MPGLHVISHGMGQDSAAMLARIEEELDSTEGRDLLVIWADTAGEKPETYAYADRVEAHCKAAGIPLIMIRPGSEFHQPAWPSVLGRFLERAELPMKSCRSCTHKGKVVPIYNALDCWIQKEYGIPGNPGGRGKKAIKAFAKQYGKITMAIGFAAGEESRAKRSSTAKQEAWMRDSIEKVFPLIDAGWNRAKCQDFLRDTGREVPLPSACFFCPFSQGHDVLWVARKHPDLFQLWRRLEAKKMAAHWEQGEKNDGTFGRLNLDEVLEKAKTKHGHLTTEELEAMVNTHGVCITNAY